MRDLGEAPMLDFQDPAVLADIETVYLDLRRQTTVARTPIGASVIRRDAVHALLSDHRLVSALPFVVRMQGLDDGPVAEMLGNTILALDGEAHMRLRRLVNRTFTPRAIDPYRPMMRDRCNELIDGFIADGSVEFMTAFADHFPIQIMCNVMGVPEKDHHLFAEWGKVLTNLLSLQIGEHLEEILPAAEALIEYVNELVTARRADPGDDLVSSLVLASEDGDRLSDPEMVAMIGGLLFAGFDTTRNQLGHALVQFAAHPDQWQLLAAEPERADAAVAESMRLNGAVPGTGRVAMEEIEVDSWRIPAFTVVQLSLASANRDDDYYVEPLRFDITAEREVSHLTFGAGPHYCLGANLAKAEMAEALVILSQRLPGLALDGEPEWRQAVAISGPDVLPLRWDI